MNLSYEYNEYVIGYVVTDIDTGRACNFQFDHDRNVSYSPVGQTYFVAAACEGDDTHADFSEDELAEMVEWLRVHDDVKEAESAATAAHETCELHEAYGEMCAKAENGVFLSDIKELAVEA